MKTLPISDSTQLVIAYGGYDATASRGSYQVPSVEAYDPLLNTWTVLTNMAVPDEGSPGCALQGELTCSFARWSRPVLPDGLDQCCQTV